MSRVLVQITVQIPHQRRRAIELYGHGTPFKQKIVPNKVQYERRAKHKKAHLTEL